MLTQSTEKYQEILKTASQLYNSEPDWVTFFREILGVDGIVRRHFTRLEDLTAFEKSPEFDQIQKMAGQAPRTKERHRHRKRADPGHYRSAAQEHARVLADRSS